MMASQTTVERSEAFTGLGTGTWTITDSSALGVVEQ